MWWPWKQRARGGQVPAPGSGPLIVHRLPPTPPAPRPGSKPLRVPEVEPTFPRSFIEELRRESDR